MLQWEMTKSNRLSLSLKITWLKQIKYVRGEMSDWPSVQQESALEPLGAARQSPARCASGERLLPSEHGQNPGAENSDEAEGMKRAREGCKAWLQ